MEQPPGFIDSTSPSHVCKLSRALYGLKQAPRAWFDRFSTYLIDFRFFCSSFDPFFYLCYVILEVPSFFSVMLMIKC